MTTAALFGAISEIESKPQGPHHGKGGTIINFVIFLNVNISSLHSHYERVMCVRKGSVELRSAWTCSSSAYILMHYVLTEVSFNFNSNNTQKCEVVSIVSFYFFVSVWNLEEELCLATFRRKQPRKILITPPSCSN